MTAGSGLFSKYKAYKEHLSKNRKDGIGGEVAKLRADISAQLGAAAFLVVEEWTNPPAAGVALIKNNVATATSVQTYTKTALDGTVGQAVFIAPRLLSVTQVTAGNHYAGSVTFYGYDAMGKAISEAVALTANPGGANTTTATTKYFAQVTKIVVPAQLDTAAFLSFGISGATIGLARKIKSRTGAPFLLHEYVDGAVAGVPGTVSAAALPYGAYTPNAAPNGAHDYAIYYEADATVV